MNKSVPPDLVVADDSGDAHRRIARLSRFLDSQFRIPGTRIRFGIDAVLGVVPGVGDAAGMVASGAVVIQAVDLGARGATLARMVLNVALDAIVGTIPVLGTVFDVVFKANNRNVRLLERHVDDPTATSAASKRALIVTVIATLAVLLMLVVAVVALVVALLVAVF